MKICFINTLYYPFQVGGAEKSVQILAESLVNHKHESIVVTIGQKNYIDNINGVKIYICKNNNIYWPYNDNDHNTLLKTAWHSINTYNHLMAKKIGKILDLECPDLVHTNNLSSISTIVWKEIKKRGIPIVHTLRDYHLLCYRSTMFEKGKNCSNPCMLCKSSSYIKKKCSFFVDIVVGNSKFILDRHLEYGYFKKSTLKTVIYNANNPQQSNIISKKHKSNRIKIGYIGNLHPSKGVELLLETTTKYLSDSCEVWIAGKGKSIYESYLNKKFSEPYIHFLGFTEISYFFSNIDILIVPSLWNEPLPRAVIEAYMFGVPVISSNRGGIPEIINDCQTGVIFDPEEPDSLVNSIKLFLNNNTMIDDMRPKILEKSKEFLPDRIVKKYLAIYHSSIFR